jgi:rod shape-determining protein MreB
MRTIVEAIKDLIDITPPELAGDIYKNGIFLCGGGSLLKGMGAITEKEVGVPVKIVEEPLLCVARGTGVIAENSKAFSHLLNVIPTIK